MSWSPRGNELLVAATTLVGVAVIASVLGLVVISLRATTPVAEDAALPSISIPPSGEIGTPPLPSTSPINVGDRATIKRMLAEAAQRYGVNAGLVMGVAWWESGWNQSEVSSTGAVGVMQVEPYTADRAGPMLLHRKADIHETATNIELGTAILKENLDRYQNDLVKALVAYYAGPQAVTDWAHLDSDTQRYVRGVYALALAFDQGNGPA